MTGARSAILEPVFPRPAALAALAAFCAATVLLVPLEAFVPGAVVWAIAAILTVRLREPHARRNLGVLLACVAVLAAAPIGTNLAPRHFLTLGSCFLAVVLGPYLFMRWKAPGEVRWKLWPDRLSRRDVWYTLLSFPLAWIVIQVDFFHLNP